MKSKLKQKAKRFLLPSATPQVGTSRIGPSSLLPSRPTSPVPPAAPNLPPASESPPTVAPVPSALIEPQNKQERASEAASSFQTLLTIVEKTLDGVPIWGPKAAIGAAAEVVRVTRLKAENDDIIKEIQREAEHIQSLVSPSSDQEGSSAGPIPAELQARIDDFKREIASHLHDLDQYQAAHPRSQPFGLGEKVKMWKRDVGEILAAEAISKVLPDVNRKIAASIQNFMLVGQIKDGMILRSIDEKVTAMREALDDYPILNRLNPVRTAFHDAKAAARACHKGTRTAVLQDVKIWFEDSQSSSLLWLSGIAGTGKTTIAQSICELLKQSLGASFLFSRDDAERRLPSNILPTIAYQLAYSRPSLRTAICGIISKDPDFTFKSVRVQAEELLSKALGSDLKFDFPTTLLVLDALDECDKENFQEGGDFIPLLLRFLQTYPSRFKVVVTSRPETSIRGMLEGRNAGMHLFVLHEVDKNMVQSDIETYLRYEFEQIATKRRLGDSWPENVREEQAKQLAKLADRLFIFAATLVKAISKSSLRGPATIIQVFLENTAHSTKSLHGSLDSMYLQIVKAVIPEDVDEQEAEDFVEAFQSIVGAIVVLQQPLQFSSLGRLLNMEGDKLKAIIEPLYSVLDVDESLRRPIQVFHLSFPDFLTNNARCTDSRFLILPKTAHLMLSTRCLHVMNQQLKRDICQIGDASLLNTEVEDLSERLERFVSAELRYACLYWWSHLVLVDSATDELVKELEAFASGRLLQWLELLSLLGRLQPTFVGLPKTVAWYKDFILSITKQQDGKHSHTAGVVASKPTEYQQMTNTSKSGKGLERGLTDAKKPTGVWKLLYDANRTVQTFFHPISEAALHVYETASTLMPHCLLSSLSNDLHSERVKMRSESHPQWGQDLRVMEGHKGTVKQIVVSPDGSLLASRSTDKTVRLWDFTSGAQLMCIDGRYSDCVAFSSDSLQILTFSWDSRALETRDIVSGDRVNTFRLRLDDGTDALTVLDNPACAAISPTSNRVAVGLRSGGLYLFTTDGTAARLQKCSEAVSAVVFSQDSLRVVSGSNDGDLYVWDIGSMRCVATTDVDYVTTGYAISHVCLSKDDLHVVALAQKPYEPSQVWIYDMGLTQRRVLTLQMWHEVYSKPLSVNDTAFACSSDASGALFISNVTSGERLSDLKGHAREVTATAFSADGAYVISGSEDSTIRIWDVQYDASVASASSEGHKACIRDVALLVDRTRLISTSDDGTTCCWDTVSGRLTSRMEKEARVVGFSASRTPVALYWDGPTIDVWNAETGEAIATLSGHSKRVYDAVFSTDFALLGSSSWDCTIRIWNTSTWECAATLTGHTGPVYQVHFSPDGSRLVSGSYDETARVWDVAAGKELTTLTGHTRWVRAVQFSPDGSRVASGSDDETLRVWDAVTGDALAVVKGHTDWVIAVRFSSDGLYIVSGDYVGIEREWKAGVDFPLPTTPLSLPEPAFHLDDAGWLFVTTPSASRRRRRLCWLPMERRGVLRSSGSIVALGSTTGVVTLLSILDTDR